MEIPDPLPKTLPIGTKINRMYVCYIAESIGIYDDLYGTYKFDLIKNIDTNIQSNNVGFFPQRILWDELPTESVGSKEEISINLTIKCSWCQKEIDNGMTLCSSHQSKCQKYYDALSERMALSYLKPMDAHTYDRECVKIFVDNKESK